MTDEVWKRNEIESPCIKICVVNPETRLCIGCHRTMEEISRWSRMGAEARTAILSELPMRAETNKPKRRGGRRGR